MANSLSDQCWALAGIAQACACVQSVARGQSVDEPAVLALYNALLCQNPDNLQELTRLGDFSLGLNTATAMLHRPGEEHIQALRYTLAVLEATSRLRKHDNIVKRLGDGIDKLDRDDPQTRGFASYDMPWEQLADIYVDTLGSLNQRIQVKGSPNILQRRDVASKIRGLLLMGVRFAWLWHQLGGRRWHLLVSRRRMWQTTQLLAQAGKT